MNLRWTAVLLSVSFAVHAPAAAPSSSDPIRFFEGRTESLGTVKLAMKKPFRSRAVGRGEILPDGSLNLIQRVEDEGEQPRERRWRMRQVAPGRYTGTMSEAQGAVNVEAVGGRYRFRFRMQGGVAIEQWLTPSADGRSATSKVSIKKYGLRVGSSDAVIRKLN